MSAALVGCVLAASLAAALAAVLLTPPGPRLPRRRREGAPAAGGERRGMHASPPSARLLRAGCLALGLLLSVAGLGVVGFLLGAAAAVVVPGWLLRREPRADRRVRRTITAELPLAVDLLAAALAAGAEPALAFTRVGEAAAGVLGERLALIGRGLRLGADVTTAWAPATDRGGEALAPLAEVFATARSDGSAVADRLHRLAAESREVAAAAGLAAAQRAGVRAVAPLGLCFLPAFVAVGIVPVVAASLGQITW